VDGAVVRWPDHALITEDAEVVATSPDHDQVAIALSEERIQVIGQAPISAGERCRSLEWLDEHTLVCAPAGPGPLLIDTRTGEIDRSVGLPGSSWFTAASQGRGVVALLEWSGSVFRLDGQPPHLTRSESASWANTMALAPDGASVALGGSWGVGLLDLDTNTLTERIPMKLRVSRVAWSPDGRWLAASSYEGDLFLYRDGAQVSHTIFDTSQALLLAFSPDSRQLAAGGSAGIAHVIDLSELDRPLAAVIAEVRAAWGAVDSIHGR
jgi:WD40 repeat protein